MEEVVSSYELLELGLDVGQFLGWELELVKHYLGLLQVLEVWKLGFEQEEKGSSCRVCASAGSSNSVDVFPDIIGGIELHYPVDALDIETSGGYVGAE